jgi:hypothetical protein
MEEYRYVVVSASYGVVFTSSFITIALDIQVLLISE